MPSKRLQSFTTHRLARFAVETPFEQLPEAAVRTAKHCVLDLVGCAAAGFQSASAVAVRKLSSALFAKGATTIWFSGSKKPAATAAYANSAAASALDLDDGHRAAGGHPGAAVLAAVSAVAEEVGASGKEYLGAIVVGYEVAVRVAAARDFSRLDTLSTGRWCGYGIAAACGRLRKLHPDRIADAMAVAGVQAPGLSASGYSRLQGNSVKEGIPWATFTALTALDLVRQGYSGPLDILDHPEYYDANRIGNGLGRDFLIEKTYFKLYACCRWIHSALDAVIELSENEGFNGRDVRRVDIHTFDRALHLPNHPKPSSLESAQYSIPFCLALAMVKGKDALLPIDRQALIDAEVLALARRIRLHHDPRLEELFPEHTAARVQVHTPSGLLEKTVIDPAGDPSRPLSHQQLVAKFERLAALQLDAEARQALRALVADLEQADTLGALYTYLSRSR